MKIIENKEPCDCGEMALWCYLPGYSDDSSPYSCDECVHRGCSCNEYSTVPEHYHPPGGISPDNEDGEENVDWKWLNEEKTSWAYIDERGRRYPCCEYMYEKDGFDLDDKE
jgi:hypothetical protein